MSKLNNDRLQGLGLPPGITQVQAIPLAEVRILQNCQVGTEKNGEMIDLVITQPNGIMTRVPLSHEGWDQIVAQSRGISLARELPE